ncbi:ATP-binding protein [Candidatus Micrarchaeota archaeon]|nr:ATP-binding protein [Candidatus Micrarchaeota archaeon]
MISQIIGGQHADILIRQKAGAPLELGELLVAEEGENKILLQVFDLVYGSQMQPEALEWASGLNLENVSSESFLDANLRNYVLAKIKAVAHIKNGVAKTAKSLPPFFSGLRRIQDADLAFLENPAKPLFGGHVRSGSRMLSKEVILDGAEVLPTHVLIAAGTGKGKSNLTYCMLYRLLDSDYAGILVLDPHNEYYGKLKSHPNAAHNLVAYSPNPDRGALTMAIHYESVKPWHFSGIVPFTDAQGDATWMYFKHFGNRWLYEIMAEKRGSKTQEWIDNRRLHEGTLAVLQRRLELALDKTIFKPEGGQNTVKDISDALDAGRKVVVDTSRLASNTELLIGSILAHEAFERSRRNPGRIKSIVIEEAPRVLREGESNVFSSIAREGRKFGVGLIAITQLASMIPREVLANMNTKIILGNEMSQEREALIGSAAQDLTDDSKAIAGLDKGEAIISSVYTKLAIPVQFPKFETMVAADQKISAAGASVAKRFA